MLCQQPQGIQPDAVALRSHAASARALACSTGIVRVVVWGGPPLLAHVLALCGTKDLDETINPTSGAKRIGHGYG